MDSRRQEINKQAWDEIAPEVRDMFRQRQRELLQRAGLTRQPHRIDWGRRRIAHQRNYNFRDFIGDAVADGQFERADEETFALIEEFLTRPTAGNRLRLLAHLRARPWLLGDEAGDLLARFG